MVPGRARPRRGSSEDQSAAGSYGSASAGRVRDLTAGEPLPKLSDRIADARGRQRPTPSRRWHFSGRAAAPLRKRSFAYHLEKSESCESGHSRVVTGDHDTIEAERLHPKAAHSRCRPQAEVRHLEKRSVVRQPCTPPT